jgi:hypothetical protein
LTAVPLSAGGTSRAQTIEGKYVKWRVLKPTLSAIAHTYGYMVDIYKKAYIFSY